MTAVTTPGFTAIRVNTFDLLDKPRGRRKGHQLACLVVAVLLAKEMDWHTGALPHFGSVAWLASHRIPWHRGREALDLLGLTGLATSRCRWCVLALHNISARGTCTGRAGARPRLSIFLPVNCWKSGQTEEPNP